MSSKYIPNAKQAQKSQWMWSSKPYSKAEREKEERENEEHSNNLLAEKTRIENIPLEQLSFKDLYQFPFHQAKYGSWVYDKNSHFIFQFELGGEKVRSKVIQILNGELEEYDRREVKHESGYIKVKIEEDWHNLILIRGWGNLTSGGGYNLDGDYACKIQDTLAEYIVEKLNFTGNKN